MECRKLKSPHICYGVGSLCVFNDGVWVKIPRVSLSLSHVDELSLSNPDRSSVLSPFCLALRGLTKPLCRALVPPCPLLCLHAGVDAVCLAQHWDQLHSNKAAVKGLARGSVCPVVYLIEGVTGRFKALAGWAGHFPHVNASGCDCCWPRWLVWQ